MTILEFLTASAGTRIIAADLGTYLHRLLPNGLIRFIIPAGAFLWRAPAMRRITSRAGAVSGICRCHLVLAYPQPAHIRLLLAAFAYSCLLLLAGLLDTTVTEEANDVAVDIAVHPAEQLERLYLIDHKRIFLLQIGRLY